MSRIQNTFDALKSQNRKALVTYIASGDPDQQTSQDILNGLSDAGADIIELGMPFTDPMADGPIIQLATQRALKAGMTVKKTLEMVRAFRTKDEATPLVLMGYFNPIYRYGCEDFITDAKSAGVDGLIIVDLPPEEGHELAPYAKEAGIDLIRLVTPVTDDRRLDILIKEASGFLYYVSITGGTGTASADIEAVCQHISYIKSKTDLPVAVGFGIKTPGDAKRFGEFADAVVVGSALVKEIEADAESALTKVLQKVETMKSVL